MKTILHKADTRGHANHGWLDARHSFSFANYYNPERISFGALRVLNDDSIQPNKGFGKHPHDNMEIITIPLEGKVLHRDSMGHEEFLHAGEVQVMSAGKGIFHEEYNGSKTELLKLLQIWIEPAEYNIEPTYSQTVFEAENALNKWQTLVGPIGESLLEINQTAFISRVFLSEGKEINYQKKVHGNASYLFIVEGGIIANNQKVNKRDALGVVDFENINIKALQDSHIINIEIPY